MQESAASNFLVLLVCDKWNKEHPALTVTDTVNVIVTEDTILMEISKVASLFNESRRETVCVGSVVDELSVDKVIDLTWKDPLRLT